MWGYLRARADYHLPPASSIAFNKAFLLSVRFSPLLRLSSGLPSSVRRLVKAELNTEKSTRRPVQLSSALKRFDAVFFYGLTDFGPVGSEGTIYKLILCSTNSSHVLRRSVKSNLVRLHRKF